MSETTSKKVEEKIHLTQYCPVIPYTLEKYNFYVTIGE